MPKELARMTSILGKLTARASTILCLATIGFAQEPVPDQPPSGVPLLRDIPILGRLHARDGEPLWYLLEGGQNALFSARTPEDPFKEAAGHPFRRFWKREEAGALPFRERWLREAIEKRFPAVTGVHVVEHTTRRYASDQPTTEIRRGLEVFGPRETLGKVKRWLDRFAALRRTQVLVEFHIIRGGVNPVERPGTVRVESLTRKEYDQHLALAQKEAGADTMEEPTALVLNGQRAALLFLTPTAYVKDVKLPTVKGTVVVDPVIDVIQDGIVLDVTPVVHPDGQRVTLHARVSISVLRRPIREVKFTPEVIERSVGDPAPAQIPPCELTLQLPESRFTQWNSEGLELPRESWFVVKGLDINKKDDFDRYAPVRIFAHLEVLKRDDQNRGITGQVIGIDPTARRVFIRWPEIRQNAIGQATGLTVWRGKKTLIRLRVIEHMGRVTICALPEADAAIRVGDLVKG
jgi:hypothetical protein